MIRTIKFLFLITILFVAACDGPQQYTFHQIDPDGGSLTTPTQHAQCELVPQFSFELDEAMEIMIKCDEPSGY